MWTIAERIDRDGVAEPEEEITMPAAPRLTTIGFDADDTLWQNEQFYQTTQAHFSNC